MRGQSRWRSRLALVAAGAVMSTAATGAVAIAAAVPDSGTVIRGCVVPSTGLLGLLGSGRANLRVIDPANDRCQPGETPLQFHQTGPVGPPGPGGPAGPTGPAGPAGPGISGYEIVTHQGATTMVPASFRGTAATGARADCSVGKRVIGGGGEAHVVGAPADRVGLTASYPPRDGASGWFVGVGLTMELNSNDRPFEFGAEAYAVCVSLP